MINPSTLTFEDVVGRGNFAVVYRGLWEGKQVALKKMRLPSGISSETLPSIQEITVLRYFHCNIVISCKFTTEI